MGHRENLEAALRGGKIAKRRVTSRLSAVSKATQPRKPVKDEKRLDVTGLLGLFIFIVTIPILILWSTILVDFWNPSLRKVYKKLSISLGILLLIAAVILGVCSYFSLVWWIIPLIIISLVPLSQWVISLYLLIFGHSSLKHPFVHFPKGG